MRVTLNFDITNAKAVALLNYIRTLEFVTVETTLDLTDEQKKAIDYGLAALDNGNSLSHEQMVNETKNRYPNLFE